MTAKKNTKAATAGKPPKGKPAAFNLKPFKGKATYEMDAKERKAVAAGGKAAKPATKKPAAKAKKKP